MVGIRDPNVPRDVPFGFRQWMQWGICAELLGCHAPAGADNAITLLDFVKTKIKKKDIPAGEDYSKTIGTKKDTLYRKLKRNGVTPINEDGKNVLDEASMPGLYDKAVLENYWP